jgi:tetratricopeptide (TPR) repeat protein
VAGAAAPAPEPASAERTARLAELESVLAEVLAPSFDWSGSSEALERFYELARDSDLIGERIAELEHAVAADPGDLALRMELADFYVARLLTLQGPEQGVWGGRAEEQWRAVIDRDAEHWEARFRLGNDYAFYPDVMGKTDDAIALLSEARAIQERSAPLPEHVQTYLSLARMHQRKGELEQARAVLRAGLRLHPDDARLEAALSGAGG